MVDYDNLKMRYFSLLATKGVSKGDIRAFIGLRINQYENSLFRKKGAFEKHVLSFEKSIIDLEKVLTGNKQNWKEDFQKLLVTWQSDKHNSNFKSVRRLLIPSPIPRIHEWQPNKKTLISLFSGAFGLDLGFLAAGFNLRFATDIDKLSAKTSKANLPQVPFVLRDFDDVSSEEILEISGLKVGQLDILVGGPPCQPFSTAGKRQGFNDPRSSPLKGFVRAIKDLRPKAFLMEEVTGLESSRLLHVAISERGSRALLPEEQPGSAFIEVLNMLHSTGYNIIQGKLNAANYGAPQLRERLIFIGLRKGIPTLPPPTHSSIHDLFSASLEPWNTLWQATADLDPEQEESIFYSKSIGNYMELIPPGGHWRQLPESLIPVAMGGAFHSGGGKMGFFRKLAWDEPTPTIVTTPLQKGTIFGHPEFPRPLGINEYKRIQGFPDDWFLPGTVRDKYKLIGNAVSVHFSYALAKHVRLLIGE